jgi:DNA polymerase-3 subunit gamma/tau
MTYQVLARKWRPRVFEEIVGQPHVVTALANALDSKRLHHAYLFTGTRGVGKTTLARILAKALNCETNGISSHPCGKCRACTEIDAGRFVDLLEVDAATNTKVDDMRELLDTAQYMPVAGRFKVYIVDEVHMLSRHAFNSMLKTLEEPPEHVKFILATTDPQRLPVTVLSRCLQFNLKPLTPPIIAGHLKNVLTAEKVPFEEPALLALGKAAGGSLRDSLSLLDQAIAHGGGQVKVEDVTDMLGTLGNDVLWPLIDRIVAGDGPGVVAEIDRISQRSISFDAALEQLSSILHRTALVQAGAGAANDEPDVAQVESLARALDPERVQVMYQIVILARRDLPLAPDEAAGFGMAMLRMLSFAGAGGASVTPAKAGAQSAKVVAPAQAGAQSPKLDPGLRRDDNPNAGVKTKFDGDWPGLVQRLNLTGMAGMAARHAELVSFENNHLQLVVPETHRMYGEKSYAEKLKAELAPHFGDNFRLTVTVGKTGGTSVAAAKSREMAQKQAQAAEAIEEDPFVRDLVNDLGAHVVSSSIRPPEDGNSSEKR